MASETETRNPGFISGPWYDTAFFLLSPLAALILGQAVAISDADRHTVNVNGMQVGLTAMALRSLIHAHLVAVLARSHANPRVFAQFPYRFLAVPLVLAALMLASDWLLALAVVVTTFWDVYHSSMQTFGLGRIYDSLRGNPPESGRTLDLGFNLVIYIVPHLVGPLFPTMMGMFRTFEVFGWTHFSQVPARAVMLMNTARPFLLGASGVFLVGYAAGWWRLVARGYRLSSQKLLLLVTTAVASISAAGFDVVGQGLLVLNVFHAAQYLALVWCVEGDRLSARLRLHGSGLRRAAAGMLLLSLVLVYGFFVGAVPGLWGNPAVTRTILVVSNLISVLHFWYDGFVWSVRKREATV